MIKTSGTENKVGPQGIYQGAFKYSWHLKCSFDGKLKSQDTVLMNLYKRVFPKWTYDPYVPDPVPWMKSEISLAVPEVDME